MSGGWHHCDEDEPLANIVRNNNAMARLHPPPRVPAPPPSVIEAVVPMIIAEVQRERDAASLRDPPVFLRVMHVNDAFAKFHS